MNVVRITSEAFKYPLSDFKKILILGIIVILSSLIIPGFLLLGYFFKIIKSSIKDSSSLPLFDDWIPMFADGLKVFIVLLIYSLIPLVLILSAIKTTLIPLLTVAGSGYLLNPSLWTGLVSDTAFIGVLLEIMVGFIIGIALANMAYHDELKAAFRFKEFFGVIKEIGWADYFIWYVVMLIIALAAVFISFFLVFPLIIGVIIVPLIISSYFIIFFARSIALMFIYGVWKILSQ
jgi:hypothetical protein